MLLSFLTQFLENRVGFASVTSLILPFPFCTLVVVHFVSHPGNAVYDRAEV